MDQLHAVKTFYDNREGLVELEDDVLSIVRQVRELYGDAITVSVEPTTGQFVFTEHCEDGTDRLIFACNELDARSLDRLQRADSRSPGYEDAYDAAEREQDAAHAAADSVLREKIWEEGERLAHALRQDGADTPMPLKVFVPGRAGWDL